MARIYKEISELTPAAQMACKAFLAGCERRGLAVKITETYRSQQRQNELYEQGRTTPGRVVTWTKNSRHTSRRAWDVVKLTAGGADYGDAGFFAACGAVARSLGITWGGDWKTPDRAHFEIAKGWKMPEKEDDEMTEQERAKLDLLVDRTDKLALRVGEIADGLPQVYHYTASVPEWARATVQKLLNKGFLQGASAADLNLSEDALRILVINDRVGLYN